MRRHTFEQAIFIGASPEYGHRDDVKLESMLCLSAWTRRGLKRKVRRTRALLVRVTRPFPTYDYSQHAHVPQTSLDDRVWPGHQAVTVARKRARVKLGLSRAENNLLVALDEADRRGWV